MRRCVSSKGREKSVGQKPIAEVCKASERRGNGESKSLTFASVQTCIFF